MPSGAQRAADRPAPSPVPLSSGFLSPRALSILTPRLCPARWFPARGVPSGPPLGGAPGRGAHKKGCRDAGSPRPQPRLLVATLPRTRQEPLGPTKASLRASPSLQSPHR